MRYELIMLLILIVPAMGQSNYIPPVIEGENYWNMYGSPNLTAAISGTNEFDKGETVTLYIDLMNYGRFLSFEKDKTPYTPMEMALAAKEQELEQAKTTAIGIVATLVPENDQIEVKSGDQVVESLKSGDKTKNPLKFTIKIGKHAPAGVYPLQLNLKYDYQYNVQVDANKFDPATNNLIGFRAAYWYQKANQTVIVPVVVKKRADFVITDVKGVLHAGAKKEELQVTYKNIGEEGVSDAIARLSIFKPFSSTDDQAYIGDLGPGEESTVVFRLDVDSDATPKEYGINSEIKYTDVRGDTVISESMKIPVRVEPESRSLMLPALAVLVILGGAGAYIYRRRASKS